MLLVSKLTVVKDLCGFNGLVIGPEHITAQMIGRGNDEPTMSCQSERQTHLSDLIG
ncbi:hypothetical protein NQZ68_022726 [Dissostichus eleginoides]|nr:hypothetical protein NQZ68_022726 [Dissostichus eleginoides]